MEVTTGVRIVEKILETEEGGVRGQERDGGFRSMRGKSRPKHSTNQ